MTGSDSIAQDPKGISVSGPEEADVVVMLHMSGVNRHMWEGVVALLDDSFRCVTVDLPGFGDLAEDEFTVDSAKERVRSIVASLDNEGVALVGLSLGGHIAMQYTAEHPEHVEGLLICGATTPFIGVTGAAFRLLGGLISVVMPLFARVGPKMYAKSLKKDVDSDLAKAIIDGGLSPRGGAQVFRRLPGTDYGKAMSGYPGPIMVINGESDSLNRRSEGQFLNRFPNAELEVVEGAGHAVPLERPELFAQAVRRLMASATKR